MIKVTRESNDVFRVNVEEGGSTSEHTVTVTDNYHQKLAGGSMTKEELVKRSFEFLLKREPKESILSSFELPVISRYFPEYEGKIGQS